MLASKSYADISKFTTIEKNILTPTTETKKHFLFFFYLSLKLMIGQKKNKTYINMEV